MRSLRAKISEVFRFSEHNDIEYSCSRYLVAGINLIRSVGRFSDVFIAIGRIIWKIIIQESKVELSSNSTSLFLYSPSVIRM